MSSLEWRPKCIIVISGKRKSGKDYVAELLLKRYTISVCTILRLSGPLKKQYAQEKGLNYEELLKASTYKETFRADMIKWGEEKRNKEPYFFCEKTIEAAASSHPLWIVSDARRKTDVSYFREKFPEITSFVRVEAYEDVRKGRGYTFTLGIDDAESECGLDSGIDWDFVIKNNGNNTQEFNQSMDKICSCIDTRLSQNNDDFRGIQTQIS